MTSPPDPRRQAGFTLVEMLVVVAILGLMTTLYSLKWLQGESRRPMRERQRRRFSGALREARSQAVSATARSSSRSIS